MMDAPRLLLAASLLAIAPLRGAHPHSIGGSDGTASWDPPVATMAERDRPDPVNAFRYVIDRYKLWPTGSELQVCFFDGDADLRRFVAEAAREWTGAGANIRFNFGSGPAPRDCAAASPAHIRIGFRPGGNWSYVGRDFISVDLNGPSMNLGVAAGLPFPLVDRRQLAQYVRHEFGHALGLQHEHQSPNAACDVDWPRVYAELGGPPNNWPRQTVDLNLRPLLASPRLRSSPYDRASVMHYALPSWTFQGGERSRCYIAPNEALSEGDKEGARLAYPATREQQNRYLDQLDASTRQTLAERNASPEVRRAVEETASATAAETRAMPVQSNTTTVHIGKQTVTGAPGGVTGGVISGGTFNLGVPPQQPTPPPQAPR